MKPFRYTAERILELMSDLNVGVVTDSCDALAKALNDDLEAHEAKCEKVYADCRPVHRNWGDEVEYPVSVRGKFTITALLWNVQPVGEGE